MDKNENIIDLGTWSVPTKWEDITLRQFSELERYYAATDNKSVDIRNIIHILCNKTEDEVNNLPMSFLDEILEKLQFLQEKPPRKDPSAKVSIGDDEYVVNIQNKLKVGEYLAVDNVLRSDRYNYAAILAIICRKEGEAYDSKYENEMVEERIKFWENVKITDILHLLDFFLHLSVISILPSQLYSKVMEAISLTRKDIESLQENGEITRRSMRSAMKKLKKLEQSINSI